MTHTLKTFPGYMFDLAKGIKSFDVRKNDRNFKEGDFLLLTEYDEDLGFTQPARVVKAEITYILPGGQFGIKKGYCVLGLKVHDYNF